MKRIYPIFALAIAAVMLNSIQAGSAAAIEEVQLSGTVRFDEVSSHRKQHRHARVHRRRLVYEGPQACSAVVFPRSPLCEYESVTFIPSGLGVGRDQPPAVL